jgi:hypothetical protein
MMMLYNIRLSFLVSVSEWYEPRDQQSRNGAEQHHDEKGAVPDPVAQHAAQHARQHHSEVHDAAGEGVVRHLMFARRDLLHHEQRQSREPEPVAEILHHDATPDEPQALRLIEGQERVGHKRQVEHQCQREQRLVQSSPRNVIARQDGAHHEGRGPESAVAKSDLLFRQPQSLLASRCLQEERHNLHHETLRKAVKDDEADVVDDMPLVEKLRKDAPHLMQHLAERLALLDRLSGGGQHEIMVDAQRQHGGGDDEHDEHPGLRDPHAVDESPGQIHQTARHRYLCNVVEGALPAYPAGLFLVREHLHVCAVSRYVVRGAAQRHHRQHGYRGCEKARQTQRESHQRKCQPREQLCEHHEEFLRAVHFQKRAPERFQRPWQHDERRPESYFCVRHAHAFVHERTDHVDDDERHPHGEIKRRNPSYGRCLTVFFFLHSSFF